jgi:hypothetical protein
MPLIIIAKRDGSHQLRCLNLAEVNLTTVQLAKLGKIKQGIIWFTKSGLAGALYTVYVSVIISILSAYSTQCARIQMRQRSRNWTYLPNDQTGTPKTVVTADSPLINTFAAIVDLSRFNNSCLRLLKFSDDNNE